MADHSLDAAKATTIRVGGVPEHFNLPFRDAIASLNASSSVQIVWSEYPGGTGAMTKALREDTLDVALVLTEGIVADLANGNPSLLVAQYVQSPLCWGVHVAHGATFQSIADLRGKRFGISRVGSGSHLMACILAQNHGWDPTAMDFVIVGGLDKAREAFAAGKIDAFMWEVFTTKPLVYSSEWRCVGTCTTPWPCFAVAVTKSALGTHAEAIRAMLDAVRAEAASFKANSGTSVQRVSHEFGLTLEDAEAWLSATEWSTAAGIDQPMLRAVVGALRQVGVLQSDVDVQALVAD